MTRVALNNWQAVHDEVLRRIHARIWHPGDLIPNEAQLAEEFGCARTTVNRALRSLADAGLLDRRRKAGTRVAMHPVRKATLNIPVVRLEIEDGGQQYDHLIIRREVRCPPPAVRRIMNLEMEVPCLHLIALHTANRQPHALEDRWVNFEAVPSARNVDFTDISANEWLVLNAPFTRGEITVSATNASKFEARHLSVPLGTALFQMDRHTWAEQTAITNVRVIYAAGYQMNTHI